MDDKDQDDAVDALRHHKLFTVNGTKGLRVTKFTFDASIDIDGAPAMGDLHYSAFTVPTPGYIIDSTATVVEDMPLLPEPKDNIDDQFNELHQDPAYWARVKEQGAAIARQRENGDLNEI